MSARAPAGRINRKNGSVAAVDIRERSNVERLVLFIIQVAAVSCAETQIPEITVANQSLLKAGFCKATQLEVLASDMGVDKIQSNSSGRALSVRFGTDSAMTPHCPYRQSHGLRPRLRREPGSARWQADDLDLEA